MPEQSGSKVALVPVGAKASVQRQLEPCREQLPPAAWEAGGEAAKFLPEALHKRDLTGVGTMVPWQWLLANSAAEPTLLINADVAAAMQKSPWMAVMSGAMMTGGVVVMMDILVATAIELRMSRSWPPRCPTAAQAPKLPLLLSPINGASR
mmetsp:Transcript_66687/g.168181  ORF Transcript_66687/g.168181 Transcript_66687/m.168181 type:complete len:151 (+) Transcript_66687:1953-2405(+)